MSREVRFRRASFRSIMECVVPCCGFQQLSSYDDDSSLSSDDASAAAAADQSTTCTTTISHAPVSSSSSSIGSVTGTFFGYRKGRVSLCLQVQDHCRRSCSTPRPLLLLEFTVPTAFLAREMQHGLLRIALVECHGGHYRPPPHHKTTTTKQPPAQYSKLSSSSSSSSSHSNSCTCSSKSNSNSNRCSSSSSRSSLFNVAAWSMYCNGRKVGFAIRRQMTVGDIAVLNLMQSVSVGAGVLPKSSSSSDDSAGDLMYLRAGFERVIGSADSESFHMINPAGSSAQELSIFLLRSS